MIDCKKKGGGPKKEKDLYQFGNKIYEAKYPIIVCISGEK